MKNDKKTYIIQGGKKISGKVNISGAKNVALKTIIASLMFDEEVILKNIPRIKDVENLIELIKSLGAKINFIEENTLAINGRYLNKNKVGLFHASKIRVSFMLFAPLLYKFGNCSLPNPGGCRIGARPIDRIIQGMKKIGIEVSYNPQTGYYRAVMKNKPFGYYRFEKPTHTGTELLVLLSLFCKEKVTIDNSANEPEIDDLINFLNQSKARIIKNKDMIIINGVKKLTFNKPYKIISDRNEAITFSVLAIASKGKITINNINPLLVNNFIQKIKEVNGEVKQINKESLQFSYKKPIKSIDIITAPHPGFMTDWQPNWAILMTQAKGKSIVHERIFENRFSYVEELKKLGAKIEYVNKKIINPEDYYFFDYDSKKDYKQIISITGPQTLHGGVLKIADLRAGATLAIAALIANGESIISGVEILERGYEKFVDKIKNIGGEIKKN